VQNAARAAALRNSGGLASADDQAAACSIVRRELQGVPIGTTPSSQCDRAPLVVVASLCDGTDPCLDGSAPADGEPAAVVRVSFTVPVQFLTLSDVPLVVQKTVRMKVRKVS